VSPFSVPARVGLPVFEGLCHQQQFRDAILSEGKGALYRHQKWAANALQWRRFLLETGGTFSGNRRGRVWGGAEAVTSGRSGGLPQRKF